MLDQLYVPGSSMLQSGGASGGGGAGGGGLSHIFSVSVWLSKSGLNIGLIALPPLSVRSERNMFVIGAWYVYAVFSKNVASYRCWPLSTSCPLSTRLGGPSSPFASALAIKVLSLPHCRPSSL